MENSEPGRETKEFWWGNQTAAKRSAWVWPTITFTLMSNLGWRLNGTPSRAAERWANDDCVANTCCQEETEIADPPLMPVTLPSAGLSLLSIFLRVCLLWLSLLAGSGGGGGLLRRNQPKWTWILTYTARVGWKTEPSIFTGLIS